MTIIVRSNETPSTTTMASTPEKGTAGEGDGQSKETLSSAASGETATEQNESLVSETEETVEHVEHKEEIETKEGEEKEPGKKKGGFQRRIDKLNAQKAQAQQELEYWKQQALKSAGASKTDPGVNPPVTKTAQADGKPKPENFDTHTEYVEALTDWKTEAKLKERDDKVVRERIDQEQSKIVNSYTERAKTFSEKTTDFADVLAEVDHVPLSPALRDIILTSDNGPELAYELAKNPEEYARIAKLPPLACAREVGKLENRLSSSSKALPQDKKITKAPKPIEPVGTGGKGTTGKSIFDSNLSQKEYEALRREQIKKRRQA